MFAPLAPILASDPVVDAYAQAVTARVEALTPVLAIVAQIAGCKPPSAADLLAQGADLSGRLAILPPEAKRHAAHDLDTLGIVLQAGLLALDKARTEGRFSRAAARLLHAEAADQYRKALSLLEFESHA